MEKMYQYNLTTTPSFQKLNLRVVFFMASMSIKKVSLRKTKNDVAGTLKNKQNMF